MIDSIVEVGIVIGKVPRKTEGKTSQAGESLTTCCTDIFCLINPQRTKRRKFPYIHPIEKDSQKNSVCSPVIDRNSLDNIPDSHTIQKNSEYRPMEKPPKKLLEQVSNIIRKRTIARLLTMILAQK
jgi:hypothetical protein